MTLPRRNELRNRVARFYVLSDKTFFPQANFIGYTLPFFQRREGDTLQLAVMEKDVFSLFYWR